MVTLPPQYYLQHGKEVFDYLENHCAHLLDAPARAYVSGFSQLNHDEQCMLIRLWSRKPRFLKRESLQYDEINAPQHCLNSLMEQGFAEPVNLMTAHESLFHNLCKPEILSILKELGVPAKTSTNKTTLIEMCVAWRRQNADAGAQPHILQDYVERSQQSTIDYLLFLFFGDLGNRFQRFAMRDLGVMRTKRVGSRYSKSRSTNTSQANTAQQASRFYDLSEAKHEFQCHRYLRELKDGCINPPEASQFLRDNADHSSAVRDKLILKLGEHLLPIQSDAALGVWQLSDQADVLQKRLRLQYKNGEKDFVKKELERLQEESLSASAEVFVNDFYARKFQGERRSVYTQMLKQAEASIGVDEVYLKAPEQGVIDHYLRADLHAEFVENKPWRALFSLIFWDLLFEQAGAQANEFDRLPLALQRGTFYADNRLAIESQLKKLAENDRLAKHVTRMAVLKHGYPTGLFQWSERLLATLLAIIKHAPKGAIAALMRRMAKDYKRTKDGYPDILVIEHGVLRFEEIKAPGDVIRPNQLVSINRLQKAGFDVRIRPVHWTTDPNQVYAVVDIETTGGRQSGNAITEIAVVKVKGQEIIGEWSTLVKPNRLIPRHITHLTGITNAMVESAPLFAEIADELREQLEGCVFVAHNVGFDYGFIKAAYQAIDRRFSMPKLCTVRSSRKAFPGLASYSLGNLVAHFDIDLDNHHRALDDARVTAHLLRLIQEQSVSISGKVAAPTIS